MKSLRILPLIIISITIILVWAITAFLIYKFIPSGELDSFGGIFGSVNSFFTGIALIGVLYSMYIQRKEIENSRFEFKFNRHNAILFSQSEYFNSEISKFRFKKDASNNFESCDFDKICTYYNEIKTYEEKVVPFLISNRVTIIEMMTFIDETFSFYDNILKRENFNTTDEKLFKQIYSRSLNNRLIDFLQMPMALHEHENSEFAKDKSKLMVEAAKTINQINLNRMKNIKNFLDFSLE